MNLYLKAFGNQITSKGKLVLLSALAKKSPFSEKYLSLLARSGKLEAHKEGRNWLSSLESLEKYLAGRERKRDVKKK